MNGLLIIDKPAGVTSHDVVQRIRRALRTRRVGHAGTLDPMATGVLPVAVGEATRLVEFLMDGPKRYRATLRLGETTQTQDSEGDVLESRVVPALCVEEIRRAARQLTGEIMQVPPMYSALKKDGVPLYRLARQGVEVERAARRVSVHRLDVEDMRLPFVTIDVICSKGTYVRTLCHDLGEILGTGAHMTSLRRTGCSGFGIEEALPLDQVTAEGEGASRFVLPPTEAMRPYPALQLDDLALKRLQNGIPPEAGSVSGALPPSDSLVVLLQDAELRAVALYEPHRQSERRGDFRLLKVFHPR